LATLSVTTARPRLWLSVWLDLALLVSICALEQIPFTGAVVHEWLGLALAGMAVTHLLNSWTWIASQTRKLVAVRSARSLVNYALNLALFVCVTAVIFTGIMISQEALPLLTGTRTPIRSDSLWAPIHNKISDLVIVLAGLHLGLNWDWAAAAGRRLFRRRMESIQ
jgi:cytochrome b